jgi:hypothetical protein
MRAAGMVPDEEAEPAPEQPEQTEEPTPEQPEQRRRMGRPPVLTDDEIVAGCKLVGNAVRDDPSLLEYGGVKALKIMLRDAKIGVDVSDSVLERDIIRPAIGPEPASE